ncbi:MAG: tRNA glutamyl-Q(34) synthetase GluQRS [Acetobacteraceae bacterium]|jgi:glutamyl-Q tRNA(Asp) synthetase
MTITTRFAPSPTGYLHIGHAFSALIAWRHARTAGGRFMLRLEDIDPVRCRPEFSAAIQEDLTWLGLDWDGPVRVQSEHLNEYAAALESLRVRGLLYPCFCSRADIQRHVIAAAPHGLDGGPLYPGTCRLLSDTERATRVDQPHALRLDMARALIERLGFEGPGFEGPGVGGLNFEEVSEGKIAADPASFGDVVIARKDTPTSYHLCVTHDDALQGVTLVSRGDDLKHATHLHRLIQALMGWPVPIYAHHRLLTDASGRRLAKRDHAMTLRALRQAGMTGDEVRERLLSGDPAGVKGLGPQPE